MMSAMTSFRCSVVCMFVDDVGRCMGFGRAGFGYAAGASVEGGVGATLSGMGFVIGSRRTGLGRGGVGSGVGASVKEA